MASSGKQNLAGLIWAGLCKITAWIFQHARFQIWALWAVGPVFIMIYGAQLVSILSLHWPEDLRAEQLKYVGFGSWMSLAIVAASFLLMANVIRKATIKVGSAEMEVETVDPEESKQDD
jgi:hypothetical protein